MNPTTSGQPGAEPGAGGVDEEVGLWSGIDARELARRWGVPAVHAFQTIGSTNDFARGLAQQGVPAGTTVVADEQIYGRGRAGREWRSAPGLGLWFSMVLRPGAVDSIAALPLVVGVKVAEALDPLMPAGVIGIKWPNDLLIGGHKLGGVLCEASWRGPEDGFVVAGVGINVAHETEDFPPEIREIATSLRLCGSPVSTLEVADRVIPALASAIATEPALDDATLAGFHSRDVLLGKHVAVSDPLTGAGMFEGIAGGIGRDGALLVAELGGQLTSVHAGTVRLIENPPRER